MKNLLTLVALLIISTTFAHAQFGGMGGGMHFSSPPVNTAPPMNHVNTNIPKAPPPPHIHHHMHTAPVTTIPITTDGKTDSDTKKKKGKKKHQTEDAPAN